MTRILSRILAAGLGLGFGVAAPAMAGELRGGGKLRLTDGVSTIEGAAGGGIASWAVIAGNAADAGIGATANATMVRLPDFDLESYGFAVGLHDRLELSYARQSFDTRAAGAALGLGRGFTFKQDVLGAKLRLFGDAVWDQDRLLPQVAIGVQHKRAARGAVIRAVGGQERSGTDLYVSATKLFLAQGLLLNTTLRSTKANQFGLLGHGGDRRNGRSLQFEGSAALMLSPSLAAGAEFRTKPNQLGFAKEEDAYDLFATWAAHRNLMVTAAYADIGDVATVRNQRGLFVQLQTAF